MTTILALVSGETSYLAADRQMSYGSSRRRDEVQKYHYKNDLLFAVAGSIRFKQLVEECLTLPDAVDPHSMSMVQYLLTYVAKPIKDLMQEWQQIDHDEEGKPCMPGNMLILFDGATYLLSVDFCVHRISDFIAIGSGWQFATGSLASTVGLTPRERIDRAMKAAAQYDLYTSDNYDLTHDTRKTIALTTTAADERAAG